MTVEQKKILARGLIRLLCMANECLIEEAGHEVVALLKEFDAEDVARNIKAEVLKEYEEIEL